MKIISSTALRAAAAGVLALSGAGAFAQSCQGHSCSSEADAAAQQAASGAMGGAIVSCSPALVLGGPGAYSTCIGSVISGAYAATYAGVYAACVSVYCF